MSARSPANMRAPGEPPLALSTSRATLSVALSACCFATIPILTLLAMREGVPLMTVLAGRYFLAAVLMLVAVGGLARARLSRRHAWITVLAGGGGQAVIAWTELSALRYISAATAVFLFYTYPAWVTVIAAVRRTETLTATRILALAVSLGGIALMVGMPGVSESNATGVVLALAGAVLYALYIPLLGRLQRGVSPLAMSAHVVAGAAVLFIVGGLLTDSLVLAMPARAWLAIAGLASLSTTLAFVLFLRGLAVLGPVRTAIVSTVEPFCAALLAALVLGQPLTRATAVGGLLIVSAVVVLQWERAR